MTSPRWIWAWTAVAAVVLALLTFTTPAGIFSGDEGVKLVQSLGVLDHGLDDPHLPYPAGELDPTESGYPFQRPWVVDHDGKHYGIYPITFTAPSAAGWAAFGFWGLHLFPLLCGIWVVYLLQRLAMQATGDRRWSLGAAAIAVFATPLGLNAALFNEHAPGVAFLLAGLVVLGDPRASRVWLVVAGASIGFAASLRSELMAAAPAVIVYVAVVSGLRREALVRLALAGAGAVAVLGLFFLYNAMITGHALPALAANLEANKPKSRRDLLPLLYDKHTRAFQAPWRLLIVCVAVGLLCLWRRVPRWAGLVAAGVLLGIWCVITHRVLGRITPGQGAMRHTIGLFTATPLLIAGLFVGLAGRRDGEPPVALACGLSGIVLAVAIFLTNADAAAGGIQLGARHMLGCVPLLLVSALAVARQARWAALALVVPLALSVWAVRLDHRAMRAITGRNAELIRAVRASPARDVVTNFWWGPQVLAPVWHSHRVYRLGDAAYLQRLRAAGVVHVVQALGGLENMAKSGVVTEETVHQKRMGVITYRLQPR